VDPDISLGVLGVRLRRRRPRYCLQKLGLSLCTAIRCNSLVRFINELLGNLQVAFGAGFQPFVLDSRQVCSDLYRVPSVERADFLVAISCFRHANTSGLNSLVSCGVSGYALTTFFRRFFDTVYPGQL
jgi:hypothetical protein